RPHRRRLRLRFPRQTYCASKKQSAAPIVFVGAVELLQRIKPVLKARPVSPKNAEKFEVAATVIGKHGTKPSAGSCAASSTRMNCAAPELYPWNPYSFPGPLLTSRLAA